MSHRARKCYARANHPKEVCNIRYERSAKLPRSGWEPITFSEEEEREVHLPHDDPFLIDAMLDKWFVVRVLVDSKSAVNVIFNSCYNQLQRNKKLFQDHEPLISFSGDVTQPLGSDYIRLAIGVSPCTVEVHTEFIIVDCFSYYNAIIGQSTHNKLKCIIAGYMLLMKFPTPNGTGCVKGSQQLARECYSTTVAQSIHRHEILTVGNHVQLIDAIEDPRDDKEKSPLASFWLARTATKRATEGWSSFRMGRNSDGLVEADSGAMDATGGADAVGGGDAYLDRFGGLHRLGAQIRCLQMGVQIRRWLLPDVYRDLDLGSRRFARYSFQCHRCYLFGCAVLNFW